MLVPPGAWKSPHTQWITTISHDWYHEVSTIYDCVFKAIHQYFSAQNLKMVPLPVTTGSISSPMGLGSDSKPVHASIGGVETYLADSMQFGLELACRVSRSGTYFLMPSFRGEELDARHLTQFYHAEVEIEGNLDEVISLSEGLVRHISAQLLDKCEDSVRRIAGNVEHISSLTEASTVFPRIRLDEGIRELGGRQDWVQTHAAGFKYLTPAGERELARRHSQFDVLWVTHFEHLAVPFYQAFEPGTNKAINADLLLGGQETIGSGQRHATAEDVKRALVSHQVPEEPYEWYIAMRQHKPMATSGMGMGVERFLMWALQCNDIRDLMLLYRDNEKQVMP